MQPLEDGASDVAVDVPDEVCASKEEGQVSKPVQPACHPCIVLPIAVVVLFVIGVIVGLVLLGLDSPWLAVFLAFVILVFIYCAATNSTHP
jgi:membrane protein YdbS with pleckstrin-like domain